MQDASLDGKNFMNMCEVMNGRKHDYVPTAKVIMKVNNCTLDELLVLADKYHPHKRKSDEETDRDIWRQIELRVSCMECSIKIDDNDVVYFE